MTWAKLSDTFHDDPDVDELSLEAVGTFALMLSYCGRHETDGKLSPTRAAALARGKRKVVDELVTGRFLTESDGGFVVRSWLKYQPTKSELDEKRASWRDRQSRHRDRNREARRDTKGDTHA